MAQDPKIEALLCEYKEMRQELRDVSKSMDTNLQIGVSAVTAVVGFGLTKDKVLLAMVPSIIFAFCIIHLVKVAAINCFGVYCQVVAARLKRILGTKEVLLDWEGGKVWENMSQPTSVLQVGFYLFFIPVIVLFVVLSWQAFLIWEWSLVVHVVEFFAAIGYTIKVMSWNSPAKRINYVKALQSEEQINPSSLAPTEQLANG